MANRRTFAWRGWGLSVSDSPIKFNKKVFRKKVFPKKVFRKKVFPNPGIQPTHHS